MDFIYYRVIIGGIHIAGVFDFYLNLLAIIALGIIFLWGRYKLVYFSFKFFDRVYTTPLGSWIYEFNNIILT